MPKVNVDQVPSTSVMHRCDQHSLNYKPPKFGVGVSSPS